MKWYKTSEKLPIPGTIIVGYFKNEYKVGYFNIVISTVLLPGNSRLWFSTINNTFEKIEPSEEPLCWITFEELSKTIDKSNIGIMFNKSTVNRFQLMEID